MMSVLYVSAVNIFKIKLFVSVRPTLVSVDWTLRFPVWARVKRFSQSEQTWCIFIWCCHPSCWKFHTHGAGSRFCFYTHEYFTSWDGSSSFIEHFLELNFKKIIHPSISSTLQFFTPISFNNFLIKMVDFLLKVRLTALTISISTTKIMTM